MNNFGYNFRIDTGHYLDLKFDRLETDVFVC